MKFPRNARIFQGRQDATPYAIVFFLLVMFVLLGARVYTPGVRLDLPAAQNLPGTDKPTLSVAMDAIVATNATNATTETLTRLYYQNQIIGEAELKTRLREAVEKSPEPLTLVIQADKAVPYEKIIQLTLLARDAGVREALLATLPRLFSKPPASLTQP